MVLALKLMASWISSRLGTNLISGMDRSTSTLKIGVSNWAVCEMLDVQKGGAKMPDVFMGEWHPSYHAEPLRDFLREHGVAQIAYGSVTRVAAGARHVVDSLAARLGIDVSSVLLKWALQQNISVIPRSTSRGHLRTNLGSLTTLPALVPDIMKMLSRLPQQGTQV